MENIIYKNIRAAVHFDSRDQIFVGRVLGVPDTISFHATSIEDLHAALASAVEDMLDYSTACQTGPPSR